jgi:hypothetical protein
MRIVIRLCGCAKASATLEAVVVDFFFHCYNLEILMDYLVHYIKECVHYYVQSL